MVTLAKHIETLLLDNDCVVVPNFGGFIAHYQSAYFDEKSSTFFPPKRVIGFNPKLIMNDGLLVQSYMQILNTDFSDANLKIEKEVDEIKEKLYSDGQTTLTNIGTISCNVDGSLNFIPSENRIDTPNLYGLTNFQCAKVTRNTVSSQRFNGRRIGNSFIGSALGVAVALILFFFLSVPVENSYVENNNYAYLGDAGLFSSIKSKSFVDKVFDISSDVTTTDRNSVVENQNEEIDNADEVDEVETEVISEVKDTTEDIQPTQINEKRYHVIISSTTSESEAKAIVNQLNNNGYSDATIVPGKGIYKYRVSICNLDSEAAAYNKINQFRANKTFEDAWVLSSK